MNNQQPWLATLLRARSAREDIAKQQLGAARRAEQHAAVRARAEAERVAELSDHSPLSATAFVDRAMNHQAAAASLFQANIAVDSARESSAASLDNLVEAARARRTAEELNERHASVLRNLAKLAGERDLDEIAGRRHMMNGDRS